MASEVKLKWAEGGQSVPRRQAVAGCCALTPWICTVVIGSRWPICRSEEGASRYRRVAERVDGGLMMMER
jgi:hypothetical protein